MPSFELVETVKGYHLIDKETWQPHHGYDGLPTYKWKATAEAALRKALGMGSVGYDPKHHIYQCGGEDWDTEEAWKMYKYTRDGRTQAVNKIFKSKAEAEAYRDADLEKIRKEDERAAKKAAKAATAPSLGLP